MKILILQILGYAAVLSSLGGLGLVLLGELEGPGGTLATASIYIFQCIIGAFLIYGVYLKKTGNDLAPKVYPASIAALILFVVFANRWLWYSAA